MSTPFFIPVVLPDHADDSSGPGTAPFGHAAVILVDSLGNATYYEFGAYNGPGEQIDVYSTNGNGTVRSMDLGQVTVGTNGQIDTTSLQNALSIISTGSAGQTALYPNDTGMLFVSPYAINQNQYDSISASLVNRKAATSFGNYTLPFQSGATNDCISFVYDLAQKGLLDIGTTGVIPADEAVSKEILISNPSRLAYEYFGPKNATPNILTPITMPSQYDNSNETHDFIRNLSSAIVNSLAVPEAAEQAAITSAIASIKADLNQPTNWQVTVEPLPLSASLSGSSAASTTAAPPDDQYSYQTSDGNVGLTVTYGPDGNTIADYEFTNGAGVEQQDVKYLYENVQLVSSYSTSGSLQAISIVNPGSLTVPLVGFTQGVTLELVGGGTATNATLGAGNVLSVQGGTSPLAIDLDPSQNYTGDTFAVASDEAGGTNVTITKAATPGTPNPATNNQFYFLGGGADIIGYNPTSTTSTVYAVDPSVSTADKIGFIDVAYIQGIGLVGLSSDQASNPAETLYKLTTGSAPVASSVSTLDAQKIVTLQAGSGITSIADDGAGKIIGFSAFGIDSIDSTTGSVAITTPASDFFSSGGSSPGSVESIGLTVVGGVTYALTQSGSFDQFGYSQLPGTSTVYREVSATDYTPIIVNQELDSIGNENGQLIGFGRGDIFDIDPATGNATVANALPSGFTDGAATVGTYNGSAPQAPPPSATAGLAVVDASSGADIAAVAQAYSGPVAGVQEQYINISPDNLNITASTPGWFLHSGSGTDAISASSGTNVLDGGTGSNFLVGGTGSDTFFVDDRGAPSDIWSTISNFHAGDAATVYGVTPDSFQFAWADGQGAPGYTGLTLHATAAGQATASLTLVGFTQGDLTNGRLSVSYGHDSNANSDYMYIHENT